MTGRRMVYRFTLETNPLTHKIARQLAMAGRWYGLDVTHNHDRAWFDRTNLIVAEGSEEAVRKYERYLHAIQSQLEVTG